jgi:TRAP-type C4-dicarboxylate transport system substrate-binding protein
VSGRIVPATLAAAVFAAAASACGGSAGDKAGGRGADDPVVLTLATHDETYGHTSFVRAVERLSGGSLRIELLANRRALEPDFERGIVEDVRIGKAQLGIVGVGVWDTLGVDTFRGVMAPLLIDSVELERAVLESPLAGRLLAGFVARGIVPLALLPGFPQRPLGLGRRLVSPTDWARAAIAFRPGGVPATTVKALGARAAPAGPRAPLPDAAVLELAAIAAGRYEGSHRVLTANVVLWPAIQTVVVRRGTFRALSSEHREILRRAGRDAGALELDRLEREETDALARLCPRGDISLVHASPAEVRALRRATRPVLEMLGREPQAKELIDTIRAMRERLPAGAETARCPRLPPAAGATRRSPLDGLWTWTVDPDELLARGASDHEARFFAGVWTIEFGNGRYEARQLRTGRVFTGTYVVRGDELETTEGTCRPSGACHPGDVSQITWSIYRDRLSFEAPSTRANEIRALTATTLTRGR